MECNAENTTQREWHALKGGDVIYFGTGWYEVFDVNVCGRNIVKVSIIVDGHVETYNVRTNGPATCQA